MRGLGTLGSCLLSMKTSNGSNSAMLNNDLHGVCLKDEMRIVRVGFGCPDTLAPAAADEDGRTQYSADLALPPLLFECSVHTV